MALSTENRPKTSSLLHTQSSFVGTRPPSSDLSRPQTSGSIRDSTVDKYLLESYDEEKAALKKLMEDLVSHRCGVESDEAAIREKWIEDADSVNIDGELQVLRDETGTDFKNLKVDIALLAKRVEVVSENEAVLEMETTCRRIGGFDQSTRDSIMSFLTKGIETRRVETAELVAGYTKIFDETERQVHELLELALAWGPMVDGSKLLTGLHERVIIAMHSYHDGCVRLALGENSLLAEASEMKLFSDLNRQKASEHEIGSFIHDLRDNVKQSRSLLIDKLSAEHERRVKFEKIRHKESAKDYDRELAIATEFNAEREVMVAISAEMSQCKVLQEVVASLVAKKGMWLSQCRANQLPAHVIADAEMQIDAEIEREECELRAAYASITTGMMIAERHASSMVEGFVPNTTLSTTALEHSCVLQLGLYRESFGSEVVRRIRKKLVAVHSYREFESKRLLNLGRSAEELEVLFKNIEEDVDRVFGDIIESVNHDFERMQVDVAEHSTDKINLEMSYNMETANIWEDYLASLYELKGQHSVERDNIQSNLQGTPELIPSAVLFFDQKAAASLAELMTQYQEKLCRAFEQGVGQQLALERIEDNIREIRNMKQQENEALENALESIKLSQLENLLSSQVGRRSEVEAKKRQYERDLIGLEEQLKEKRQQSHNFLQTKLALARAAREKALIGGGVGPAQAKIASQADMKEFEDRMVHELETRLDEEELIVRDAIRAELDQCLTDAQQRADLFKTCINGGLTELRKKGRDDLQQQQTLHRLEVENEYIENGMSSSEAKKRAADELADEEAQERENLMEYQRMFEEDMIEMIENESKEDLARRELWYEQKRKSASDLSKAMKKKMIREMDELLAKNSHNRGIDLFNSGLSEADARETAATEMKEEETLLLLQIESKVAADEQKVLEKLDSDWKAEQQDVFNLRDDTLASLRRGVAEVENKKRAELSEKLTHDREKRQSELETEGMSPAQALATAEEECAILETDISALNHRLRQITERLENAVDFDYQDKMHHLRSEYEKARNGLQLSMDVQMATAKTCLQDKLKILRNQRASDLAAELFLSPAEIAERLQIEFDSAEDSLSNLQAKICETADKEMIHLKNKLQEFEASAVTLSLAEKEDREVAEYRDRLLREEKEFLSRGGDEAHTTALATREAAKRTLEEGKQMVENLKHEHDASVESIKKEMEDKRRRQLNSLHERISKEMKQYESEMRENNVEEDEIQQKLNEASAADEKRIAEMNQRLLAEEKEAMREMKRKLEEKIQAALAAEHERAMQLAAAASAAKSNAMDTVISLRQQHEEEFKRYMEQMAHTRSSHDSNLRSRLLERKAKLKTVGEDESFDSFTPPADLDDDGRENREKETNRLLREMEDKHAREMAIALQEARQADLDAAAASAREAALQSDRLVKARSEQEANEREAQRLLEDAQKQGEKQREVELAHMTEGKERLEQRLAERKERKERELREQEERALAELAAKQAAEKIEKEKLREAKMLWTERIEETSRQADGMNIGGRSKEDYCFQETLGKGLVPEAHLSDAAQIIMRERHANEMAELLKVHFDQRVKALKSAVETVMQEKAEARVDLVDKLVSRKATDDFIKLSLNDLDTKFSKKQSEAEEGAVMLLERDHTRQQIALRQRQLEEVSTAINLYSKPEQLARLSETGNKTQAEVMADYRAKLAAEKQASEEKLRKEREESEALLRSQHEKNLQTMKHQLEEDQLKEEREIEAKRGRLLQQKEEFERKQEDATGQLHKKEKQRIIETFEKELNAVNQALDHEKAKRKQKLQSRLANQRQTRNQSAKGINTAPAEVERGRNPSSAKDERKVAATSVESHTVPSSADHVHFNSAMQHINSKLDKLDAIIAQMGSKSAAPAPADDRLVSKLERLEKMLEEKYDSKAPLSEVEDISEKPFPETAPSIESKAVTYYDHSNPPQGEVLAIIEDNDLSVQELARLNFGRRLATMVGVPQISMQAARSLPPSGLSNNAFNNSYLYDEGTNTLYVHSHRLSSSGDFGLVAIHALSHIKIDPCDISNDADPQFTAEFYTNLKILSQDLYKKSAGGGVGATTPSDRRFSMQRSGLKRTNSWNITSPVAGKRSPSAGTNDYFSSTTMKERIRQYAQVGGIPQEFLDRYADESKNTVPTHAGDDFDSLEA